MVQALAAPVHASQISAGAQSHNESIHISSHLPFINWSAGRSSAGEAIVLTSKLSPRQIPNCQALCSGPALT
jgi:hypothetical protein